MLFNSNYHLINAKNWQKNKFAQKKNKILRNTDKFGVMKYSSKKNA